MYLQTTTLPPSASIFQSPRHCLTGFAFLLCGIIALCLANPAAAAEPVLWEPMPEGPCVRYRMPGGGGWAGDDPRRVVADGEDLVVTVDWDPDPALSATFVLVTPGGIEVGVWPAARVPGEQAEQRLDNALAAVSEHGFQYRLRLVGASGEVAESGFRVVVDCPPGKACRYHLREGLESSPVTVSEGLWNALAEARDVGATDLIASARDSHPELEDEIPGLLWQLQQSGAGETDGCFCDWVSVENATHSAPGGLQITGNSPNHVSIANDLGAGLVAAAQTIGDPVTLGIPETSGTSFLSLQLLCVRAIGGADVNYATLWPSLPELTLQSLGLEACALPCLPRISHRVDVDGCAEGAVAGHEVGQAESFASLRTTFRVNNAMLSLGDALVDIDADIEEIDRGQDRFRENASGSILAQGSSARLYSEADLHVEGLWNATGNSYAYVGALFEYDMRLWATSTCPEVPAAPEIRLYFRLGDPQGQGGGVVIERWEDP